MMDNNLCIKKGKRYNNILVLLLLAITNISAQIVYDTILSDENFIGRVSWDEIFLILDYEDQLFEYYNNIDFNQMDCYGTTVILSATFGRNGKLKDTRIVRAASPFCDSIAFHFIHFLKDWLPGLRRGRFVDIPFIFPVRFDSLEIKKKHTKTKAFFSATEEQYNERKKYFNFIFSDLYEQEIVNDFDWFKLFIAETYRTNRCVHILSNYKQRRNESIILKIDNFKSRKTRLLVRDPSKDWILYEYIFRNNKVRVPRERDLILIFFEEGPSPLIQTMIINSARDKIINLNLERYTKGRLLSELNKYGS